MMHLGEVYNTIGFLGSLLANNSPNYAQNRKQDNIKKDIFFLEKLVLVFGMSVFELLTFYHPTVLPPRHCEDLSQIAITM